MLRGVDVTLMLILQGIAIILLLVLQTYVKPFRHNGLNRLDSFCLFVNTVQIMFALLRPERNRASHTLSYVTSSLTAAVFVILVINMSSKCLGKFKIKKCNTRYCENKETHHSREIELDEDKEEYDEMRQALLMLAD